MEFGPVPVARAAGAMLAHSLRAGDMRIGKGEILTAEQARALQAAGVTEIWVARPGPGELPEDEAARIVAAPLAGPHLSLSPPFRGRVNLLAEAAGVIRVDGAAIFAANRAGEAATVATLPDFTRVAPRQMLATVKIIPYAAPTATAQEAASRLSGAVTLHPFRSLRAALILTRTATLKPALLAKGEEALAARLAALGAEPGAAIVTAHEIAPLAAALRQAPGDIILILAGSATSDRRDIAPAALVAAGGRIARFGMPVDPGNLLFLGDLDGRPVLGLPGSVRSPKLSGADWVLERLIAGLPVGDEEIAAMGVGGLLKEIPSRPQPRGGKAPADRPFVSAILLAAVASSRMRGADKLLEDAGGAPLIRRAAEALTASRAAEVLVVLRPGDDARRAALGGLKLRIVENPQAAEGMGASIRAGMSAIATEAGAALIALADMPEIGAAEIDRLIAAFAPGEGAEIARAATETGAPGNPVLFGRRFFEALSTLEGDEGARSILAAHGDLARLVPLTAEAARVDLDTPEDWALWRGRHWGGA
ncbi:MAG: NTP transferase domain-containing protein [Pikeienuella sp.]